MIADCEPEQVRVGDSLVAGDCGGAEEFLIE